MKKVLILLVLLSQFIFATEITTSKSLTMESVSKELPSIAKGINWTNLEKINSSLPKKKITVGFDIDDTILFSSPVFYYGQNKYSPGKFDYLKNQDFWNEASNGLDKFSIPKESAIKIATMHLKRGDTVYFITGRTKPTVGKETLTTTLRNLFPKKYRNQIQPVVFAHGLKKEKQMKEAEISLYYGDSDSDITSANHIGIRAIRFLRNAQSTYKPLPKAGKFGEEVLEGSDH